MLNKLKYFVRRKKGNPRVSISFVIGNEIELYAKHSRRSIGHFRVLYQERTTSYKQRRSRQEQFLLVCFFFFFFILLRICSNPRFRFVARYKIYDIAVRLNHGIFLRIRVTSVDVVKSPQIDQRRNRHPFYEGNRRTNNFYNPRIDRI